MVWPPCSLQLLAPWPAPGLEASGHHRPTEPAECSFRHQISSHSSAPGQDSRPEWPTHPGQSGAVLGVFVFISFFFLPHPILSLSLSHFFWGVGWGGGQSNVLPLIYTTTLCPQFKTQSSISQELPWSWEKPGPISTNASALGCHLIINNRNGSLSSGPGDS